MAHGRFHAGQISPEFHAGAVDMYWGGMKLKVILASDWQSGDSGTGNTANAVPLPAPGALLGLGLILLFGWRPTR